MKNAVVLYVHDRDYFAAETHADKVYLDECERERLARIQAWRDAHRARSLAIRNRNVRFHQLAEALQRAGH